MTHTLQQDFEHFLSYSGLSSESEDVKAKLLVAYTANWSVLGKGSQIQRLLQTRDSAVAELEEWRFTNKVDELQRLSDAKQAKIDALMLEFCPEEMTPEQMATWGACQRLVPESERIFTEYRISNQAEYSAAVAKRNDTKLPASYAEMTLGELLERYWNIAFSEGQDGVSHGTEAQQVLSAILAIGQSAPVGAAASFKAWWAKKREENDNVAIGADYQHWARLAWNTAIAQRVGNGETRIVGWHEDSAHDGSFLVYSRKEDAQRECDLFNNYERSREDFNPTDHEDRVPQPLWNASPSHPDSERDAARYRWLRKQHEVPDTDSYDMNRWTVFKPGQDTDLVPVECEPGELDRQIHAQIAKESK